MAAPFEEHRAHLRSVALRFAIDGDRIIAIDIVAEPARLAALDLAVLSD
jgi:hypothetical protein